MSTALLHRRLTAAMSLAALLAFMAGAGASPEAVLAAGALSVACFRLPPPEWSVWIERISRTVIVGLCAWMLYVAFVLGQDFMPAVIAMLLFLLAAESLRSVDAKNDSRLYLLAFALLLAATAYYPGLGFAAAFIAFIVLSTLALMVGYLRRQSERFGVPGVRPGRRMMTTIAALSAVTLLVSAALFVLFPRLPRQWNVQGRAGGGDLMAGFSDEVRLGQHGGRIVGNPQVAFRVEFPDGIPRQTGSLYWRGRSFDRFDGVRWTRTRGMPPMAPPSVYGRRWGGQTRTARIFGGPPQAGVLFGGHPILAVQPRSAIRVSVDRAGDVRYVGTDAPVYTVTSGSPRPSERALRASDGPTPTSVAAYLQVPEGLDPRVDRLADSLTAGLAARIDRVRAIERWLSTELAYTLELPETRDDATVEGFLFRRRAGHCEYFSTAMVMMLRTAGIPSRNVTGFLGGEWNDFGDYLAVTGNDAHSWVEAWFPGLGWVPFDPTPSARNAAVALGTDDGWMWSAGLWFDGMEHRWYKWVLDYNLEKQIGLFSRVGDLFSRGDARGSSPGGGTRGAPRGVAVVIALGVLAAMLWSARRWRRAPLTEETRAYLALRRAYARTGLGGAGGPLDFAERLARERSPGAGPAAELVRLYVRARFGAQDVGEIGRLRMRQALDDARAELRASKRKPARLA
jgi:transglutaminase-like putative cysteine protease